LQERKVNVNTSAGIETPAAESGVVRDAGKARVEGGVASAIAFEKKSVRTCSVAAAVRRACIVIVTARVGRVGTKARYSANTADAAVERAC